MIILFLARAGINDSGSTGDASSTTGEMVGADAAALSGYGDGAPLVCIPSTYLTIEK